MSTNTIKYNVGGCFNTPTEPYDVCGYFTIAMKVYDEPKKDADSHIAHKKGQQDDAKMQ